MITATLMEMKERALKLKSSKPEAKKRDFNYSSVCLTPMLGLNWKWIRTNIVDFYLGDFNRPEFDNNILCLTHVSDTESLKFIDKLFIGNSHFVTEYDIDKDKVMYVFKVPDEYKDDYELFKQGKYSRMSDALKQNIIRTFPDLYTFDVLTRSEDLRESLEAYYDSEIDPEAELLDPPNPKYEIYNYRV